MNHHSSAYHLIHTPEGLGLSYQPSTAGNQSKQAKPLVIDFSNKALQFRKQQATTKNEAIAKAVGLKKGYPCTIIDTTAGLGQDAFILAYLGAHLTLLERSPIIAALLEDAFLRLSHSIKDNKIRDRMHLIPVPMDACDYLSQLEPEAYPDVVYCDPMFPAREKSALVKKDMQYLQGLLLEDPEQNEIESQKLLAIALKIAKKRVVVKRPRWAPGLVGPKPHFQYLSKNNRFDIYPK